MTSTTPPTPPNLDAEALSRCRQLVQELDSWSGMACRFPNGEAEAFSVAAELLQHAIDGTDALETRLRGSLALMRGGKKNE